MGNHSTQTRQDIPVTGRCTRFPFDDVERTFNRIFGNIEAIHSSASFRVPKTDVIDDADAVTIHVELPGVRREDLEISITDRAVTVRGKTHPICASQGYCRCEIEPGEFNRSISLPVEIDGSRVNATLSTTGITRKFENGMRELIIPKRSGPLPD